MRRCRGNNRLSPRDLATGGHRSRAERALPLVRGRWRLDRSSGQTEQESSYIVGKACPIAHVLFCINVSQVVNNSILAYEKLLCYLRVAESLAHQQNHIRFTFTESGLPQTLYQMQGRRLRFEHQYKEGSLLDNIHQTQVCRNAMRLVSRQQIKSLFLGVRTCFRKKSLPASLQP